MGAAPDWYRTLSAARYLGVAPWDLANRSRVWTDWALTAQSAEGEAKEEIMKHPDHLR